MLRLNADQSEMLRMGMIELENDDIASRCVGPGLDVNVVKPRVLIPNTRNEFIPRHTDDRL